MTSKNQRECGVARVSFRKVEGGDAGRKSEGLKLGGLENFLERFEVIALDAQERDILFAVRKLIARFDDMEIFGSGMETPLGLDFQEAGEVGLGQVGQLDAQGEHPGRGDGKRATALANAGFVEVIADFAADEFRIAAQGREREVRDSSLLNAKGPIDPAYD